MIHESSRAAPHDNPCGCASSEGHIKSTEHVHRLAAIGELTASILHQINGPLTYVLFNLEHLEQGADAPESLEALRCVREGVENIRVLSRDVTVLARGSAHRATAVDLGEVVRSALRITGPRVRSVAGVIDDVGASPRVRGDETLFLQVIVNTLLNAAEACEAAGIRAPVIRVSVSTDVAGNASVAVADNGPGLPAEHAARVFDAFFTTKEPGKGTGLGLSIAKRIVDEAGGRITFDSMPGLGSLVRVVLPPMRDE